MQTAKANIRLPSLFLQRYVVSLAAHAQQAVNYTTHNTTLSLVTSQGHACNYYACKSHHSCGNVLKGCACGDKARPAPENWTPADLQGLLSMLSVCTTAAESD